jgi:opacity protein-like surface antigen
VDPLVGAKLTGKLGPKNSIALLYTADALPDGFAPAGSRYAHVPVFRYKRSLADDSFLGLIYAGRERSEYYNRVGGADGELRVGESSTIGFHGLYSQTKTDPAASPQTGHAIGLNFQYNTRDLGLGFSAKNISQQFAAHTGYVTRTGVSLLAGSATLRLYPDSELFRRISIGLFSGHTLDRPSSLWETYNSAAVSLLLGGTTIVQPRYIYSTEIFLDQRFLTGGYNLIFRSQVSKEFLAQVSFRSGYAIFYSGSPYQGKSRGASASVTYQPLEDLALELTYQYSDFTRDSDSQNIYEVSISRSKLTYQVNRYLFLRGTAEYNTYHRKLLTDLLFSFTYIPGTVFHAGYGSLFERLRWEGSTYVPDARFIETQRAFFVKASYLWQL